MSNPAVIKLHKKKIGGTIVWLDDNIGESIHIHIDNIRVDLSVNEFSDICSNLEVALDNLVSIEGFSCKHIDPIYFESMLWQNLTHLKKVKLDYVDLKDMLAPGTRGIKNLEESRAVKALRGNSAENDIPRASHHIGQSSAERLNAMLKSVKDNGYPMDGHYIIMYGDDNIIRDGQHRAACLYVMEGNKTVPVKRLYFDNYIRENICTRFRIGDWLTKKVLAAKSIINKGPRGFIEWIRRKRNEAKKRAKVRKAMKLQKKLGAELVFVKDIIDSK